MGFIAGSAVAIALLSAKSKADSNEDWGDLGYSHSAPVVEEVPMSMDSAEANPRADATATGPKVKETFDVSEPEPEATAKAGESTAVVQSEDISETKVKKKGITDISTVQNTYGVMTEEKTPITLFVSPYAGISSVFGNDTADSNPQYAYGAAVGLLVSSNMRVDVSYTYAEENFSNPRVNSTQGVFVSSDANVFTMKQSSLGAGVKLYVLGRESRFRPFLGGGGGYTRGTLNYTAAYLQALGYQSQYTSDFTLNQVNGFGEIGTEFAFTKNVVASASFKLSGVLSSNSSGSDQATAQNYDPSKLDVGNSLSRTASYMVSAGLGFYF